MKIISLQVWNFGSYPHLQFDFEGLELALIYGPTGSGKSTLMDAIPWILYGQTSKGGGVAEVRSWQAMEESTKGVARLQTASGDDITITRIRGNAKSNDLFWTDIDGDHRGKDLLDTQKRIETILGVSSSTYLSSAYFHEFSPVALFFTSRSKVQRELLEEVAPLGFPIGLAHKASEARKEAKRAREEAERQEGVLEGRLQALFASKQDTMKRLAAWDTDHANKVKKYTENFNDFETNKSLRIQNLTKCAQKWAEEAKVESSSLVSSLLAQEESLIDPATIEAEIKAYTEEARCPTCKALSPRTSAEIAKLSEKKAVNAYNRKTFEQGRERLQSLASAPNPYDREIASAEREVNGWEPIVEATKKEVNPFRAQLEKVEAEYKATDTAHSLQALAAEKAKTQIARLTSVYDLSFELRGHLLAQAIQDIQDSTNKYLHDYFDAEIKVGLSIEGADSLTVNLQKSGYDCVYTQLSKGQRQLLKLCFGISVMKASANAAGAHFDTLFFDEALDGLDSNLKMKSYRLFEELAREHENVLVIDHSVELQELFYTKFQVSMTGDSSEMERITS